MGRHRTRSTVRRQHHHRRIASLLVSGLLVCGLTDIGAAAAQAPATATTRPDAFAASIAEAAQRFAIPEAWIRAVMRMESRGQANAVSPKGAMGLMQIMPSTWSYISGRHALGQDPYDPRANILAGAAYLRAMFDRYGSVDAMLAAYNAGPGRYEASRAGRPLPAETVGYVTALAPVIDGRAARVPIRLAAADPLAWTRASLFTVQPERGPAADRAAAGAQGDRSPAASSVRDISAIVPQADGLFVARTGAREPR